MEPGDPDVMQQVSVVGNPMQPSSGSYGADASAEKLKASLQLPGSGPGPGANPTPPPPPGLPQGQPVPGGPGGVPSVLMKPTSMPDVPVSTPLRTDQPPSMPAGAEARIAALQSLSASPNVSESTREWAKQVLKALQ